VTRRPVRRARWNRLVYLVAAVVLLGCSGTQAGSGPRAPTAQPIRHVFVINLENKDYTRTWGPNSAAPYLSRELRQQGVLLTAYHATAHHSLGNYLAQISGQGPNGHVQDDCPVFSDFAQSGTAPPGQAVGHGCVFPSGTPTLAGQLTAAGLTWKGYLEDMGTPCRHPAIGERDTTHSATVGDQYAVRHNPFMYFHEIIDSPACERNVVDLSALPGDLRQASDTPNLAYVTPNLCHDAHDAPCVDGAPGGLVSADAWLREWVPQITASPAFRQDGLLVITFDESDGPESDSSACCGEGPGPNAAQPGIDGTGGGRVGALVIAPTTVVPDSTSGRAYNHYSLLASIEDLFGLPYLGYAGADGLPRFGTDVYNLKR